MFTSGGGRYFRLGGLNDNCIRNDLGKSAPQKIFVQLEALLPRKFFFLQLKALRQFLAQYINRIFSNCTVFCNQSSYQRIPHSQPIKLLGGCLPCTRGHHIYLHICTVRLYMCATPHGHSGSVSEIVPAFRMTN